MARPKTPKDKKLRWLLGMSAVVGVLLWMGLLSRISLLERALTRYATRTLGIPVQIHFSHFAWGHALVDLELPELEAKLSGIALHWNRRSLWPLRYTLNAELPASALTLKIGPSQIAALRASVQATTRLFSLESSTVQLGATSAIVGESRWKQIEAKASTQAETAELHLQADHPSLKRLHFEISAKTTNGKTQGTLRAKTGNASAHGPFVLETSGEDSFQVSAGPMVIHLRDLLAKLHPTLRITHVPRETKITLTHPESTLAGIRFASLSLDIERSPEQNRAQLDIEGLGPEGVETCPASAKATLNFAENGIQGQGTVSCPNLGRLADLTLRHEFDSAKGHAALHSRRNLQTDPLDLSALIFSLDPSWRLNAGSIGADVRITWRNSQSTPPSAQIHLQHVGGTLAGVTTRELSLQADFRQVWPLHLRHPLSARLTSFGDSLALEDIELTLSTPRAGELKLDRCGMRWLEGGLSLSPTPIRLFPLELETKLEVQKLSLKTLLASTGTVEGYGTLSGSLPLHYRDGDLEISRGTLKSDGEGGWLSYPGDESIRGTKIDNLEEFQNLLSQGQTGLVFKALDNFFFSALQVDLFRPHGKTLEAAVKLRGRNPDLVKGMPFEFNINLTGRLENALRESWLNSMLRPESL